MRTTRLRRIRAATRLVMRHVGLAGHCDCVLTRDEHGREGVLLRIETDLHVPAAERAQLRVYLRRKLFELGVLGRSGALELHLLLLDRDERGGAARAQPSHVSSRRIASLLRGANPQSAAAEPHGERVTQLRRHLSARRRQRIDSDFSPLQAVPLTELSPLGEA